MTIQGIAEQRLEWEQVKNDDGNIGHIGMNSQGVVVCSVYTGVLWMCKDCFCLRMCDLDRGVFEDPIYFRPGPLGQQEAQSHAERIYALRLAAQSYQ